MNVALWIVQALLALLFLANGIRKLVQPHDALAVLPIGFVRFIGCAELLGAIGLILPAATRIAPVLTPAAALGLAILMVSAMVFHARRKEYIPVGVTMLILAFTLFILYGRLALAPIMS